MSTTRGAYQKLRAFVFFGIPLSFLIGHGKMKSLKTGKFGGDSVNEGSLEKRYRFVSFKPEHIALRLITGTVRDHVVYHAENAVVHDDDDLHHLRLSPDLFSVAFRRGLGGPV
nr:hypothetical protein [uncultured bacterium]